MVRLPCQTGDPFCVALQRTPECLACLCIPNSYRVIHTPSGNHRPVRRVSDCQNPTAVALEGVQWRPGVAIPDSGCRVTTSRNHGRRRDGRERGRKNGFAMSRYRGRASRNGFDPEDGLRGEVERDSIFGGFQAGLEQGMIQICRDINCLLVFIVGLVCEPIWYSLIVVLGERREKEVSFVVMRNTSTVPTLPCNVFKRVSKFLTFASATGTDTAGPVADPVAWSKNCTRTLPRSAGMLSISCCCRAFSLASVLWRLVGGGRRVAILPITGELRLRWWPERKKERKRAR